MTSQTPKTIKLTHWGRHKMAAVLQTTLSNAFSWMKMLEFRLRFHWSLFLRVQLTIIQHWIRWWLGADQATSHYLNQWWLDYRRIYASLGLNELIFIRHWSKWKVSVRCPIAVVLRIFPYPSFKCMGAYLTLRLIKHKVTALLTKHSLYEIDFKQKNYICCEQQKK